MRWKGRRQSTNIEDRRGAGARMARPATGGLGLIVIVLVSLYLGVDPTALLQTAGPMVGGNPDAPARAPASRGDDEMRDFIAVVLADTEETWQEVFRHNGRDYQEPKLVLFSDAVRSACGMAQSAVGPFYCPGDNKVYIDLSFYGELRDRFGAPGDFARAYVVAHEIGHHVQTLLGVSERVNRLRQRMSEAEANALSVKMELQADCFAGVWANHADRYRQLLESGDVEEGLTAAAAIGDDRLQKQSQGYVVPDSFTHGSSAQRVEWFKRGIASGQIAACDTFGSDTGRG